MGPIGHIGPLCPVGPNVRLSWFNGKWSCCSSELNSVAASCRSFWHPARKVFRLIEKPKGRVATRDRAALRLPSGLRGNRTRVVHLNADVRAWLSSEIKSWLRVIIFQSVVLLDVVSQHVFGVAWVAGQIGV